MDVPLCYKDAIWVRSHYDAITVAVPDAPVPDEIVVGAAVANRGRLNARLGGMAKEEASARTGCDDLGRHLRPGRLRPPRRTLALRNLRAVVTGRLGEAPVAAGTLRVEAGRVVSIGADPAEADVVLDAAGAVAVPGLIDTHCHVVFGDYTPRQHAVGFMESSMHGGVTMVMSASEVHLPGRPRDRRRGQGPGHGRPARLDRRSGPAGSRCRAGR